MSRVSTETLQKLNDFIESLPSEARSKCAICNETLTHIVKTAEATTGAGTATVCRALAQSINRVGIQCKRQNGGDQRILYIAEVPDIYPHWIKIGVTTANIDKRINSLSGIFPAKFKLIAAFSFPDATNIKNIENMIFEMFSALRIKKDKEFFHRLCLDAVIATLDSLSDNQVARIY